MYRLEEGRIKRILQAGLRFILATIISKRKKNVHQLETILLANTAYVGRMPVR